MTTPDWAGLDRELDAWAEAGHSARIWLRDDDAIAPSGALDRLARLGERFSAPVLLAVIPAQAAPELAGALAGHSWLLPCQHGCRHENHAPAGAKKSEFGAERAPDLVAREIADARDRLGDLLDTPPLPVFVPPWNRIAPVHAAALPSLGFGGLSCFRNDRPAPESGLAIANTHLDVVDWHRGRIGRPLPDLVEDLRGLLECRREAGSVNVDDALGLLLHHRDHDEGAWSALDALLGRIAAHPAVAMTDPRRIFGLPAGARRETE